MTPELRLVRYFLAVAEAGNMTRAAQRLHIAQPSLSAAIKQLETQLGVELLRRDGRGVAITRAGELLQRRGRELLEAYDALLGEVRARATATSARLRLGVSPTARYGVAPRLLAACAEHAPALMLYTTEDTTGALLRSVGQGTLDAAVTFCASTPPSGVQLLPLAEEAAVVHVATDHRLAHRAALTLADLADETVLTATSPDSAGYTDRVLQALRDAGVAPSTLADPYPDLGLQAVRERLGVVIYPRSGYPSSLDRSVFLPLDPPLLLPFELAVREDGAKRPSTASLIAVARRLHDEQAAPSQPAGRR
jgi:DNA-binding transcriptional LysR family regulator